MSNLFAYVELDKIKSRESRKEISNMVAFNTLTGLRPEESQKVIYLIKTKQTEYVDSGKML
jgi:hypothetical protein